MFILDFRGSMYNIYVFRSKSFKGRLKKLLLLNVAQSKKSFSNLIKDQMDTIFDDHSKPDRRFKEESIRFWSKAKNPPVKVGDAGLILGLERSFGEGNGNPLQNSAWEILWTKEPVGLWSLGLQRVVNNLATEEQQQNPSQAQLSCDKQRLILTALYCLTVQLGVLLFWTQIDFFTRSTYCRFGAIWLG